ncbi:MAG: cytidine deaminase [Actinomycetota bacterium]
MNQAELVGAARKAAEKAYAPYSRFRVGAAVLAPDGRIYTGANVENASYPVTNCAEAIAVGHAVSEGVRQIVAVAVACIDAPTVDGAYPCGRCRQILNEFATETVFVTTNEGEVRRHTLTELLPHGFK